MFPVWEGVYFHSAFVIALIAVFHVLVSHLTVAAAWFNYYIERRAYKENRPEFYEFLRRSALGLLVFSYVFGALTGVGIWQSATAGNARGTSALIHNFVLYWGSEWFMFLIDVIGIIAYFYTFNRIDKRNHLRLALLVALGGTGTLAIIVGILSFKLTPGNWLTSGLSLDGFYNPTFWPMLIMRFLAMLAIVAVWVMLITSTMPKDQQDRLQIMRVGAQRGLLAMVAVALVWYFWYLPTLPQHAITILGSVAVPPGTVTFVLVCTALVFAILALTTYNQQFQTPAFAVVTFIIVLGALFGAERIREVMRKPDLVAGYISSNQLIFTDLPARGIKREDTALNASGMSGKLPFLPAVQAGNDQSQLNVGRALVVQQCSACHSVSAQTEVNFAVPLALRSLGRLLNARGMTEAAQIETYLNAIGAFPYMHPVVGNTADRQAMAAYLSQFAKAYQARMNIPAAQKAEAAQARR